MKRVLLLGLVCVILPLAVHSTPYISPEKASLVPFHEDEMVVRREVPASFTSTYDPLNRFEMCADFITTLQVSDTSKVSYGGMREAEHMLTVIQTDNTSEAIWIWTHYYSLTGQDSFHANIDAAWEYCMNFPAYDEEGGSDLITGYYRVYNCAWALRAEMEYRQVYGDATYSSYADSCASYLCHNPLMLRYPVGFHRKVNGLVMGWAVGNLYEYGDYVSNPIFMSKAIDMADSLKEWAEANPNKFHWKEWAMSGGSLMWGIVNSYFQAYPTGLQAWVETYAPYLDTEVDSSEYQNAWRAWAALGQSTASEVLDSGVYAAYFKHLADTLVANDGDNDGGIPVLDADPDDRDQSWVTNYLGYMCMDRLIATAGLVTRSTSAGHELHVSVAPMPSCDLPSLAFRLDEPSHVFVEVYEVTGRNVASMDVGVLGPGFHSIPLSAGTVARAISPGVYFYTLHSGRKVANGKIVMLR